MMKFIEQVGNIKIYTERVKENDDVFIDVMCCNGSKIIIKEGRCYNSNALLYYE